MKTALEKQIDIALSKFGIPRLTHLMVVESVKEGDTRAMIVRAFEIADEHPYYVLRYNQPARFASFYTAQEVKDRKHINEGSAILVEEKSWVGIHRFNAALAQARKEIKKGKTRLSPLS